MASFRVCAPCSTTAFYHPPGAHEHDVLGTIATHVARPRYDYIDLPLADAGQRGEEEARLGQGGA
jgi:hypothetical protein